MNYELICYLNNIIIYDACYKTLKSASLDGEKFLKQAKIDGYYVRNTENGKIIKKR